MKLLTLQPATKQLPLPFNGGKITIDEERTICWWNAEGKLHRLDGPACEWANGNKEWFVEGKYHRLDGPACEYASGNKFWYVEGKLHRLDGPAVEWADGSKLWYVEGKRLTEEEFKGEISGRERRGENEGESGQILSSSPSLT